jgi:TolB-like protein
VLFFRDDTPDQSAGQLANALSRDLIGKLLAVPVLDVPSLQAVQPYRNRSLPLPEIAKDLRAGWLVGGIVERRGDRILVQAELTDSTGRLIDSRIESGRVGADRSDRRGCCRNAARTRRPRNA